MGILQRAKRFFGGPDKAASRERRKLKRMACHQEFVCTKGKQQFPVVVVDVGFGGFRIQSDQSVGQRGDLLHLRRISTDFRRHLTGAYTTGLMVRVAWVKSSSEGFEAGLHLPEAPGSMRISWFKELLSELGLDEVAVFTKRSNRRHRCRLPAQISQGDIPTQEGLMLDLSSGGGLFAAAKASPMGEGVKLQVTWGRQQLEASAEIVGVRPNPASDGAPGWLHSLKFQEDLTKKQERLLYAWLEDLERNG